MCEKDVDLFLSYVQVAKGSLPFGDDNGETWVTNTHALLKVPDYVRHVKPTNVSMPEVIQTLLSYKMCEIYGEPKCTKLNQCIYGDRKTYMINNAYTGLGHYNTDYVDIILKVWKMKSSAGIHYIQPVNNKGFKVLYIYNTLFMGSSKKTVFNRYDLVGIVLPIAQKDGGE